MMSFDASSDSEQPQTFASNLVLMEVYHESGDLHNFARDINNHSDDHRERGANNERNRFTLDMKQMNK